MTIQELYSAYLTQKATVELLRQQQQELVQQLYTAEQLLNELTQQVRSAGDQALLNSLGV